jgi:hypothetical protein
MHRPIHTPDAGEQLEPARVVDDAVGRKAIGHGCEAGSLRQDDPGTLGGTVTGGEG